MRFTDGHSSSGVCSPSRYTLLTGRYHWRTRLQSGIVGVFGAPLIAPERMTIASLANVRVFVVAGLLPAVIIAHEQDDVWLRGKCGMQDAEQREENCAEGFPGCEGVWD